MIQSKADLKEWLSYERAKYGLSGGVKDFVLFCVGSERAVIWSWQKTLRKTEYYYNTGKKVQYAISLIMLNHKSNKYGLHIGKNVCAKGLKIMHLGPILANGSVKMGEDVSLHINTSFVAKGTSDDAPAIGNGCVVGVGAVVMGGVRVADYVAIGANSVVCKDIDEENIAVAGSPAKKISNNGSLEWGKKFSNKV